MKAERLTEIFRALQAYGLVVQQLRRNLWLIPVPETLEKVWIVNPDGFTPHETRATITVARCVILGFGKHETPDINWKATGAVYYKIESDADILDAFREVGYDMLPSLEHMGLE